MSWSREMTRGGWLLALALAVLGPFVLHGCSGDNPATETPSTVGSVWSPPGAVGSFLVEPGPPIPTREYQGKPWADWRATPGHRAHGGSERVFCKDCHAKGFAPPIEAACGREGCHKPQSMHPHGAVGDVGCLGCHAFAPGKPVQTCIACHDKTQTRAGGTLAAIVDGHAKAECGKCHKPHEERVSAPAECASCHEEQKGSAHALRANSKGCTECHAPHSPASTARETCVGCHAEKVGPHARHAPCLSCHDPHAAALPSPTVCKSCHGHRETLRAKTVAQHAQCTSCHAAHAPNEVGDASCTKCHANARVDHPARAGGSPPRACAACHVPHPSDPNQKVAHCTSCHANVGPQDQGIHASTLSCTSCHVPHDFRAPTQATSRVFCARCHAGEAKLAATRTGHSSCVSCHATVHVKSAPPACATCHAQEAATATKAHQVCNACHEPHSGARLPNATCASCHADRAAGPHQKVPGGCSSCHRAHGPTRSPTPPACGTCHAPASRKGMHLVAGHADCARCHTVHAAPLATRDACTATCHTDRKTHEPNATKCSTCHVFKW